MKVSKKQLGLYLHVPFCLQKCGYCNFYSVTDLTFISRFVDCLCEQISLQKRLFDLMGFEVDSIYFGGGTPSLLNATQFDRILNEIYKTFFVSPVVEVSLECNPCNLTFQFLSDLKLLQFNRLSVGIQSAVDSELRLLGRVHSFYQASRGCSIAFDVGFSNISADLIVGLPGQTFKSLAYSLTSLSKLPLTHLSLYILKIEPGTRFASTRFFNLPDNDMQAVFYETASDFFQRKGFSHYEISNFALPDFECVHNLKYWTLQDYLGFGPGAHSFFGNHRFFVKPDMMLFLNHCFDTRLELPFSTITKEEWLMLRLRLKQPVLFSELIDHGFNLSFLKFKLQQLACAHLINLTSTGFYMTSKGFLLQNRVFLFLTT